MGVSSHGAHLFEECHPLPNLACQWDLRKQEKLVVNLAGEGTRIGSGLLRRVGLLLAHSRCPELWSILTGM